MDEAQVLRYIAQAYPDADIYTAGTGTFMSCDPEKHWPNFATLVAMASTTRPRIWIGPGVYRLNIGISSTGSAS